MINDSKAQKTLTSVTLAFTILLPLLYICGFAYEAGYLSGYGINDDLFPKSVPEYLTSSLLFFLNTFGISVKYIIAALAIIVSSFVLFAVLLLFVDYTSDLPLKKLSQFYIKIETTLLKIKKLLLKLNFKILAQSAKFAVTAFVIFYALLGLMLSASIITFIPFLVGQKVASDEIKKTKLCNSEKPADSCVSLMEYGNVIASGNIVASSDKYIALYNDGKTVIYSSKDYDINIFNSSKTK